MILKIHDFFYKIREFFFGFVLQCIQIENVITIKIKNAYHNKIYLISQFFGPQFFLKERQLKFPTFDLRLKSLVGKAQSHIDSIQYPQRKL